jgi:outer membrane protein OmpA-like peptidoglycan-associated protein
MGGCAASLNPLQPVITSSRSVHRRNHRAYAPVSAAFQHRFGATIMHVCRNLKAVFLSCSLLAVAGCETAPPPPVVRPAAFIPLGVGAAYLNADVIGGYRARAAKMRAAKIRPLSAYAVPSYMADLDRELRQQTAGIGLDVLNLGNSIVVRIPAAFTFDAGSAAVKAQTDATLLEIARTVKTRNQTFVDVLAHTDTTGTPQGNQALSEKRAAAVATYLAGHGVARARIASRGLGETAPLYNPDTTETQKAANRRIEIRLVPYR